MIRCEAMPPHTTSACARLHKRSMARWRRVWALEGHLASTGILWPSLQTVRTTCWRRWQTNPRPPTATALHSLKAQRRLRTLRTPAKRPLSLQEASCTKRTPSSSESSPASAGSFKHRRSTCRAAAVLRCSGSGRWCSATEEASGHGGRKVCEIRLQRQALQKAAVLLFERGSEFCTALQKMLRGRPLELPGVVVLANLMWSLARTVAGRHCVRASCAEQHSYCWRGSAPSSLVQGEEAVHNAPDSSF
mmetsp:Transcript_44721/g.126499  ORF Transcript_44721/g.126499 Transcript_44721/m.126499 type:complete len:248 (-) Transcript_44721:563-1306(-)